MSDVNRLADILLQNPDEQVKIEGHTDNVGNPIENQVLSDERANAVREALIARGVSPDPDNRAGSRREVSHSRQ